MSFNKVSEKLPKDISCVLVWTNISTKWDYAFYVGKKWLYFSTNENFWLHNEPHIEVWFWMDLPERPSDELLDEMYNLKK